MPKASHTTGDRSPRVRLRPGTLADRDAVFEWATASDATAAMMGPPHFPDHPMPTREEFFAGYHAEFFTQAGDGYGRVFVIEVDGREIGCVSYDALDDWHGFAEFDIWIARAGDQGRGWGTEAIVQLQQIVLAVATVEGVVMRPSRRNTRAIAAYRKAGFEEFDSARHRLPGAWLHEGLDYADAVVLVRLRRALSPGGSGERVRAGRVEPQVPSPCTNVCRLDDRGQVCVGCGRTTAEITGWPAFTASERRQVLERLRRCRGEGQAEGRM